MGESRGECGLNHGKGKPHETKVAFVSELAGKASIGAAPMQRVSQQQLKILSRNIRRLREQAGLTQEQLAEKADITPRSLQFIETAQFGASLAVLIRLRRALDCRWETMLEGIE